MPLTGWRDQRDWPDPQAHWSRAGRAWLLRCAACAREVIMLWYLRRRRNGFERQLGTTAARYGNATWSARPFKRASLRKANSQTARSMDIGVPSATQVERCRAKVPYDVARCFTYVPLSCRRSRPTADQIELTVERDRHELA
jgi:hypothetical protein